MYNGPQGKPTAANNTTIICVQFLAKRKHNHLIYQFQPMGSDLLDIIIYILGCVAYNRGIDQNKCAALI